MSVTSSTNRSTNPALAVNVSGYSAVAGTGGVANLAWNAGAGYARDGFGRVTWTTGTTSLSGGASFLQTGLSASQSYVSQMWVWSSKAQNMRLIADFKNSGGTTVNTVNGFYTAVPALEWTPLRVTGTSGALVDRVLLTANVAGGTGTQWVAGDTLDIGATMIQTGTTVRDYFDGSTPDGGGTVYAWTGTVDASTSTATVYLPVMTLVPLFDDPCPRVEITLTDLNPAPNTLTIWRVSDGVRRPVRGAKDWSITGSDTVTDYECPLGRVVQYDLDITAGVSAQVEITSPTTTVSTAKGWIQDPLDPGTAIPLYPGTVGPAGEPSLTSEALKQFEYIADISLMKIMGTNEPVALVGQRMAAANIPFDMFTDLAQQSTNLRNLLQQSSPVLIRPLPAWAQALPGLCYVATPRFVEVPVNEQWGGAIIEWKIGGDLVKAPSMNIIVPVITYGDVQAIWPTYQAAQTALASKKYLDVKKNPDGV